MNAAEHRDCVIAGGGPAGMMLGYLLARQGRRVTVLEKHGDFLRDFRGDTIHPSTLTVLGELGLRERFLELPVHRISSLDAVLDGRRMTLVDFDTLPPPDDMLVFAPQWDLLNFLAREAATFEGFELRMSTSATEVIVEHGVVVGVVASSPDGAVELRGDLIVAADGRGSAVREAAGLVPTASGVPIDVLWFHLPKPADAPPPTLVYATRRGIVLTIDRGDYYQSGLVIAKGGIDRLREAGLTALRETILDIAPVLNPVVSALDSWDQVKLLSVQLDHLKRWYLDGLICIGDAAHAMSPVGGVGINYAVQDAVALANAIAALPAGRVPITVLEAVQRRRMRPVLRMQGIQRAAHDRIARTISGGRLLPVPAAWMLRLFAPVVRRITARVIGLGFLPEHVRH